jgi:hypothetical protein
VGSVPVCLVEVCDVAGRAVPQYFKGTQQSPAIPKNVLKMYDAVQKKYGGSQRNVSGQLKCSNPIKSMRRNTAINSPFRVIAFGNRRFGYGKQNNYIQAPCEGDIRM